MRILLISLHYAEYAAMLAEALAMQNSVTLVLYGDNARAELGSDFVDCLSDNGVKVVTMERPRGLMELIRNMWCLWRSYSLLQPDVVHAQEAARDELSLLYPLMLRSRRVLTIHDPEKHQGDDARRFRFSRHRLYRWLLRSAANRAITHGAKLIENLAFGWPRLASRCVVIPHGPLGVTSGRTHQFDDFRKLSQVPSLISSDFLFFGRIQQYKGLGNFLRAIQKLSADGHEVRGIVAGRGPDIEPYREFLVNDRIFDVRERFIPAEEAKILFCSCRAVVLPYLEGTQSGVAAMALGFGAPVIATAVGSIPEIVRHGVNGLLVPPGDAVALEEAMLALIRSDALCAQLREGARSLACGDMSWTNIAVRTIEAYTN